MKHRIIPRKRYNHHEHCTVCDICDTHLCTHETRIVVNPENNKHQPVLFICDNCFKEYFEVVDEKEEVLDDESLKSCDEVMQKFLDTIKSLEKKDGHEL